MTSNTPTVHPGRVLYEQAMQPLGVSRNKLARDIDVPVGRISDIVSGKRGITPDTALRLSKYFGTDAELWMRLQSDYDLHVARDTTWSEIEPRVREYEPSADQPDEPDEPVAAATPVVPDPQTVVQEPEAEPAAPDPDLEPVALDSDPEPFASELASEPVATDPDPEHFAWKPDPEPVASKPNPEPVATERNPEPVATEPNPEPVARESNLEPDARESNPEPDAREPVSDFFASKIDNSEPEQVTLADENYGPDSSSNLLVADAEDRILPLRFAKFEDNDVALDIPEVDETDIPADSEK